jgi:photosystem II stability/assembly factor-like uncharacterized protein
MKGALHLYAGTAGHSMWFSEDGGDSWVHPNSHSGLYLEARVWAIADHPANPSYLYAGTDMGLYRYDEADARFTHLPSPMSDVWAVAINPDVPETLIAGTRPAALFRSDDAGASWRQLGLPGLSKYSPVNMGPTRVTQVLYDTVDADTLWATVEIGGIFRSNDSGNSWIACNEGLVSQDIHGIAILRDAEGRKLLYATTNQGLHRSDDNGSTWRFQQLDSPWQYTRAIAVNTAIPGTMFLANGNGPPGSDGRLLRSRDFGHTWHDTRLPGRLNSSVWCIAMSGADPQMLFVCTNLGQVFRSADGGDTWQRLEQEFGELRALHWRSVPADLRKQPHSLTRVVVKAKALTP